MPLPQLQVIPGRWFVARQTIQLPTRQYPHLPRILNEVDFHCKCCSEAEGRTVYRTLAECQNSLLPLGGDYRGRTTRFSVFCPSCRCAPGPDADTQFMENGIIDLARVPKNYTRPSRGNGVSRTPGMFTDEEVAARAEELEKARHKDGVPPMPNIELPEGFQQVFAPNIGWFVMPTPAEVAEDPQGKQRPEVHAPAPRPVRSVKTKGARGKAQRLQAKVKARKNPVLPGEQQ